VEGWLEDSDPFFVAIEEIVEARHQHRPRVIRVQYTPTRSFQVAL